MIRDARTNTKLLIYVQIHARLTFRLAPFRTSRRDCSQINPLRRDR